MNVIGIDPGLQGALSVLSDHGALIAICDTPTLQLRTTRGQRQEYDLPAMAQLLAPYRGAQTHVWIEEAQPMPGQGTRSMFQVGLGMGVWLGLIAALGLAHTRIRPAVWKRALRLTSDKEQCRLRAMQIFPTADLRRKKDHGRAEALLLGYFGLQFGIGSQIQQAANREESTSHDSRLQRPTRTR